MAYNNKSKAPGGNRGNGRRPQAPAKPKGPNPLSVDAYKHVFAAYSNMAQFNAFRTVAHISMLLEIDPDGISETKLDKAAAVQALESPMAEVAEKARHLFERHFPFLLPMTDYMRRNNLIKAGGRTEGGIYKEVLIMVFRLLNHYRNHTTHYRHEGNVKDIAKGEAALARPLMDVLRASVFRVEENYCKHPAPTDAKGQAKVEGVVRYITRIKQDMAKDVFMFRLDEKQGAATVLSPVGKAFFLCLFLHKKYITEFLSQIHLFYTTARNAEGRWEKREDMNPAQRGAILDIFAAYRISLPKARYDTESDPAATLAFDILGELQKAPSELLDTLSDSDKELFRIPAPEAALACDVDSKQYFRRHTDRFPLLALRYLDVTRAMDDIRFQVQLGTLRYAFYLKRCIDSDEPDRVRSLQLELNGFGRLDEIERARRSRWAPLLHAAPADDGADETRLLRREFRFEPDTPDSAPYINDFRASYLISGSRIGLHWGESDALTPEGLPAVEIPSGARGDDLARKRREGEWNVRMQEPKCFLSTYELPALLFHEHLRSLLPESEAKAFPSAENIIKAKTEAARSFFRAVHAGEVDSANFAATLEACGLRPDEVPEKLADYFAGRTPDAQKRQATLRQRYEELCADTARRLEAIRSDLKRYADPKNRRGRDDFRDVRPGRLADWLAADIVGMQPSYVRRPGGVREPVRKLTGLNYQVMQKSLAVYAGIDTLRAIFRNAGLTGAGAASHPFLDQVRDAASTVEFYEKYLKLKAGYLKGLAHARDYSNYSFLARGVAKWQDRTPAYIRELAGRYLEGSVELPRGLFTASIAAMLKQAGHAYEAGAGANASWLIAQYYKNVLHDGPQSFYNSGRFRRSYRVFELLNPKLEPQYLTEEQMSKQAAALRSDAMAATTDSVVRARMARSKRVRGATPVNNDEETRAATEAALRSARRAWDNGERAIRRYKVQDMVLFLLAKRLLALDSLPDGGDMRLAALSPFAGDEGAANILDMPMRFSVELPLADGRRVRITQPDLKPKNYGDFYAFFNDTRLDSLISYVAAGKGDVEIDRGQLEREFQAYDVMRPDVFRLVHEVERSIYERFREQFEARDPEVYYFTAGSGKMARLNNFNNLLSLVTDALDAHELLTEVRNAFSHNRYTRPSVVRVAGASPVAPAIVGEFERVKAEYVG